MEADHWPFNVRAPASAIGKRTLKSTLKIGGKPHRYFGQSRPCGPTCPGPSFNLTSVISGVYNHIALLNPAYTSFLKQRYLAQTAENMRLMW